MEFSVARLACFLFCSAVTAKTSAAGEEALFQERLSLFSPHVGENGRNEFFEFDGHFLSISGSQDDHTQMGYFSENTGAVVQSREPIKQKHFKFEVDFDFTPEPHGNGVGFWLSDKLIPGSFYGRNSNYTGFGMVIDASDRPAARVVDSSGNVKSKTVYPRMGTHCKAVFIVHGNKVIASLNVQGTEYVLYSGEATVLPDCMVGLSTSSGKSKSVLYLYSIAGYSLKKIKDVYVKGETQKSGKLILLLGLLCIAGLIYYLYKKQGKDLLYKN